MRAAVLDKQQFKPYVQGQARTTATMMQQADITLNGDGEDATSSKL
jgi:hypothetical protein